jgi:hypothetical protein
MFSSTGKSSDSASGALALFAAAAGDDFAPQAINVGDDIDKLWIMRVEVVRSEGGRQPGNHFRRHGPIIRKRRRCDLLLQFFRYS